MRNIFGPILASGLLMAAAHAADSETTTYSCDYALPVKSADDPSITVKEYIPFSYYVDAQREPTYTLMPPFATFSRNRWEFAILYTGPIILIKGGHVPEDLAHAAEMKLAGDLGQKRTDCINKARTGAASIVDRIGGHVVLQKDRPPYLADPIRNIPANHL